MPQDILDLDNVMRTINDNRRHQSDAFGKSNVEVLLKSDDNELYELLPGRMSVYSNYLTLYDNDDRSYGKDIAPIRPHSIGCVIIKRSISLTMLQGTLTLLIDGEQIVLENDCHVHILPKAEVRVVEYSRDMRYFAYSFSADFRQETVDDLDLNYDITLTKNTYLVARTDKSVTAHLSNLYADIEREVLRPEHKSKHRIIRAYGNIIVIYFMQVFEINLRNSPKIVSRQNNIYNKFMRLLNDYSMKEREVQFYARMLDITPKYLSAICIQCSGKNASHWIDQFVIHQAKQLMAEHSHSLSEISQMLNFPSQSFFGRYFKRITGLPPKAYMIAMKNKANL